MKNSDWLTRSWFLVLGSWFLVLGSGGRGWAGGFAMESPVDCHDSNPGASARFKPGSVEPKISRDAA